MPGPPTGASFLTMPSTQNQFAPAAQPNQFAPATQPSHFSPAVQQSFIAQNNLMHAQAAVAQAAGTVPVSIMQLGARGRPPTTLFGQNPLNAVAPIPRASESTASGTPKDEDFEWIEYVSAEGTFL